MVCSCLCSNLSYCICFHQIVAPGVPPPGARMNDHIASDSIKLSWSAIPEEEENGNMKGYIVTYQIVRQSGIDTAVGNHIDVVKLDKHTFSFDIKGLVPYTDYRITLYGYANAGDGPKKTFVGGKKLLCLIVYHCTYIEISIMDSLVRFVYCD